MSTVTSPILAQGIPAEEIRAQLARIVNTAFRGPSQMTRFLEFAVDRSLAGDIDCLKESVIGVEVCGRGRHFDPRTDPIVRVTANRLRAKLEQYYDGAGKDDEIRIEFPTGGYVPNFRRALKELASDPLPLPAMPVLPAPASLNRSRRPARIVAVLAFSAAAALGGFRGWRPHQEPSIPEFRFPLAAPQGRPFEMLEVAGAPALSPDGSKVAYGTRASNEMFGDIRIASLMDQSTRTLRETGPGRQPFWSPDGSHLAVTEGKRLRRILIANGSSTSLCDNIGMAPGGGAWSDSGTIVYAPASRDSGLFQVPASGGECQKLTIRAADEEGHAWPHFLPGQDRFLYTALNKNPRKSAIYVSSLRDPSERKLVVEAHSASAFIPGPSGQGTLLYVSGGALMTVRFHSSELRVSGEPWIVESGIGYVDNTGAADFSVSRNGVLTFRHGTNTPDRQLVWVSRTGKRDTVPAAAGVFRFPHLNPDGRSVLAESMDRAGVESNIWLIAGTDRRSVTIDPGKEVGPVWSPDGKRFAYAKDEKLWIRDIQGGAPELLSASVPGAPTSWSLDGQKLAVTRHDPVTIRDACVIDLGKPGKPVSCPAATPFIEHDAQISPDGEWLAYRSNESGRTQVYVVSLRACAAHRVQVSPPDKDASGPRWRRDGKELYFIRETKMVAAPVTVTGDSIHFGAPTELFDAPFYFSAYGYSAAPDGSRFLFSAAVGGNEDPRPGPMTVVLNRFGGWKPGY